MTASDSPLESPSPASRRIVLPIIDTGPLFDLQWLVLLLPLWWVAGVEQFIWPIGLAFITVKVVVLQRVKVAVTAPVKWFALFLVAILISSLFIVEPERWLTYLRNSGAYAAGFMALLIITNRVRTWPSASRLLDAALIALIVASLFGLLAIAGIWRPSFESLFGRLLPAWIVATSYGHDIAIRILGEPGWFVGLGYYYRISSLFLYGNHYASILVYTLPFLFFRLAYSRGISRLLVAAAIPLLIINLVYTTSRVAVVALLGGGIYFILFQSIQRKAFRILSALAMTLLILGVLLTGYVELSTTAQDGMLQDAAEAAEAFIFARGPGSYTSRLTVYEYSLRGFLERPAFGWGTERDIPQSAYPAGSHSEYVAVMYRQGLLGLIAFAGLLWSTWRFSRPVSDSRRTSEAGGFLRYGRWLFVTALINSIAADPVIDTTVYVFLWLFLGLMVATSMTMRREADVAGSAQPAPTH